MQDVLNNYCRHIFKYKVALVDETGHKVIGKIVGSDSCSDNKCSTLLDVTSSNLSYMVAITTLSDGMEQSDTVTSSEFSQLSLHVAWFDLVILYQ